MADNTKTEALKKRVEARKHELMAKLNDSLADGAEKKDETESELREQLAELQDAVRSGWDNLSDAAVTKIEGVLDRKD